MSSTAPVLDPDFEARLVAFLDSEAPAAARRELRERLTEAVEALGEAPPAAPVVPAFGGDARGLIPAHRPQDPERVYEIAQQIEDLADRVESQGGPPSRDLQRCRATTADIARSVRARGTATVKQIQACESMLQSVSQLSQEASP